MIHVHTSDVLQSFVACYLTRNILRAHARMRIVHRSHDNIAQLMIAVNVTKKKGIHGCRQQVKFTDRSPDIASHTPASQPVFEGAGSYSMPRVPWLAPDQSQLLTLANVLHRSPQVLRTLLHASSQL